jgi:hypothetical protein
MQYYGAIVDSLENRECSLQNEEGFVQIHSMIIIANHEGPVSFTDNTFTQNSGGRGIFYITLKETDDLIRSMLFAINKL